MKAQLWKEELENVLLPMLEKYEVVVVEDNEHLIRWYGMPLLFDLQGARNGRYCGRGRCRQLPVGFVGD